MIFAIKVHVIALGADTWVFDEQKTMYQGKQVRAGDTIFIFDSENEGGSGLIAKGLVLTSDPTPLKAGIERQTPRVSITVQRVAVSTRQLGRSDLKPFSDWGDGRPQTELNFKFYRQATNKIVGLSEAAASFLEAYF